MSLTNLPVTPHDLAPSALSSEPNPAAPFADQNPAQALPVLIRATNGKASASPDKLKLSTVVQPDDLANFFTRYADVWKAGMPGLKKRDRSGRKAKAKDKKKKQGKDRAAPTTK